MARWFVDRSPHRGIPSVSLRRLLPEAQFVGCHDWEVSGCTADSRHLDPGQVFVAIPDGSGDGLDTVRRALDRGAAGVVVERPCPEAGRLQVVVPDARAALARLCQALAGDPSEQLRLIGLTGLAGMSTVGLFLRSIFEAAGARYGRIGPDGWSDGITSRPAGPTFPAADGLAAILAAMVDRGCEGGVIEVAPDDLERRALDSTRIEAAIVTYLGASARDRPRDDAPRLRSRAARLFRGITPGGTAIVNADDPSSEILGAVNLEARRVAYSIREPADLTAEIEHIGRSGTRFRLQGFDREAVVHLRMVGTRGVSFALAAAAMAWSRGLATDAVVDGLEAVTGLPGQFEAISEGQPFTVRIDRARTAEGLRIALEALGEIVRGRIHCVLGAEGDGDRAGRIAMARAAEAGADRLILTADNPRDEDPDQILDDLLSGLRRPARSLVEADRRLAIESALSMARPGDGVLIAGKGHETFQIFADRAVPFDDRAVVAGWLREHAEAPRRATA